MASSAEASRSAGVSCSAAMSCSGEVSCPSRAAGMRSGPQVLALVGSRPGLIFMVRMIVLRAPDGVRGGSLTLACMSGPGPQRQQLSGAQSPFPAGPAALTAGPEAASTGVLAVQVGVGDGRVDRPGNRDHAAGGVDAAPGDRLQAAGLQGEAEVH